MLRSRSLRALLLVPTVVLALGLAGCSEDDGPSDVAEQGGFDSASSSVPGEPISAEAFIEQANQICRNGNQDLAAAAGGLDVQDPQAIRAFVRDTFIPSVRQQLEDIEALGLPAGDEETVQGLLDASRDALDEVEADPTASFLGDTDPFAEVNAELTAYGLTECGSA